MALPITCAGCSISVVQLLDSRGRKPRGRSLISGASSSRHDRWLPPAAIAATKELIQVDPDRSGPIPDRTSAPQHRRSIATAHRDIHCAAGRQEPVARSTLEQLLHYQSGGGATTFSRVFSAFLILPESFRIAS